MAIAWRPTTEEMAEVFSVRSEVQTWLDFEAALARAEAVHGVIPQAAADEITAKARVELIDLDELRDRITFAVHPIMPFVTMASAVCEGDAGEYYHWGTTTQDVLDTGWVLRVKRAEAIVRRDLEALIDVIAERAREHRATPMAGRTHSQHGIPITFGYKLAVWVDELRRLHRQLVMLHDDTFALQLGGATGTLASIGPVGFDVRRTMAADLGLSDPDVTWHVARDRFSHLAYVVALVAGSLQRAAYEIVTLQRTEVAELREPHHHGKVGSSTMPHKRNPAVSESMWTLGEIVKNDVRATMSSLGSLHERDKAVYTMEVDFLPRIFGHTHRMLEISLILFRGLTVDAERMIANMDLSDGMLFSERALMVLAERMGRQAAHEVLYDLTMEAAEAGTHLRDALLGSATIMEHFTAEEVDGIFDPHQAVETAAMVVDRVCPPTA